MTTEAAAQEYLARHMSIWGDRKYVVYNPLNREVEDLPWIIGFNNGGVPDFYHAQLVAEDGTDLGAHRYSHEGYMPHDLGIIEGARPDRHETFRAHYPEGYRMDFVSHDDVKSDERIMEAVRLNGEKYSEEV